MNSCRVACEFALQVLYEMGMAGKKAALARREALEGEGSRLGWRSRQQLSEARRVYFGMQKG